MIWPNDLQTRRSQYTGIPLDRLHWNHTGWCYLPVVFQWQSSVNLHNWNTLEDHWKHTGNTLATNNSFSQVHWGATWTTLADASTQWYPNGNPMLICIIGTHWKHTGSTLDTHWLTTIISPVAFQCTLGYKFRSKFQAHWIATGLPLNYHWLRVTVINNPKFCELPVASTSETWQQNIGCSVMFQTDCVYCP